MPSALLFSSTIDVEVAQFSFALRSRKQQPPRMKYFADLSELFREDTCTRLVARLFFQSPIILIRLTIAVCPTYNYSIAYIYKIHYIFFW